MILCACLGALCIMPDQGGEGNETITQKFKAQFSSPPYIKELVYKFSSEQGTHFGLVKLQPDAFLVKSSASLENLHSLRFYADTRAAGCWGERYWFINAGQDPTLRVSDAASRSETNALAGTAAGVVNGCYGVAMEGLSIVFLFTPAWKAGVGSWSDQHLNGRGWFGQEFHGELHLDATGAPEAMDVSIAFLEGDKIMQRVKYSYSSDPLSGYFPKALSLSRISPDSQEPRKVAEVEILSFKTNAVPLGKDEFEYESVLNAGIRRVLAYTNGKQSLVRYNDQKQGKFRLFSILIPKRYLPVAYVTAVFLISLVLLAWHRMSRSREEPPASRDR
jgi:hypothetical protein